MKGARRTRKPRQDSGFADLMTPPAPPAASRGIITGLTRAAAPSSPSPRASPAPADDWGRLLHAEPRRRVSPQKPVLSGPASLSPDSAARAEEGARRRASEEGEQSPMQLERRNENVAVEAATVEAEVGDAAAVPAFLSGWDGADGWADDPSLDDSASDDVDGDAWGAWAVPEPEALELQVPEPAMTKQEVGEQAIAEQEVRPKEEPEEGLSFEEGSLVDVGVEQELSPNAEEGGEISLKEDREVTELSATDKENTPQPESQVEMPSDFDVQGQPERDPESTEQLQVKADAELPLLQPPVSEAKSGSETIAEVSVELEAGLRDDFKPVLEPQAEQQSEKSDAPLTADTEPQPESDLQVESELNPNRGADADHMMKAVEKTGGQAELGSESEAEVEVDVESEVKAEVGAEVEVDVEAEVGAEVEAEVEAEAEAETEVETETETEAEVEAEVETEVKTEVVVADKLNPAATPQANSDWGQVSVSGPESGRDLRPDANGEFSFDSRDGAATASNTEGNEGEMLTAMDSLVAAPIVSVKVTEALTLPHDEKILETNAPLGFTDENSTQDIRPDIASPTDDGACDSVAEEPGTGLDHVNVESSGHGQIDAAADADDVASEQLGPSPSASSLKASLYAGDDQALHAQSVTRPETTVARREPSERAEPVSFATHVGDIPELPAKNLGEEAQTEAKGEVASVVHWRPDESSTEVDALDSRIRSTSWQDVGEHTASSLANEVMVDSGEFAPSSAGRADGIDMLASEKTSSRADDETFARGPQVDVSLDAWDDWDFVPPEAEPKLTDKQAPADAIAEETDTFHETLVLRSTAAAVSKETPSNDPPLFAGECSDDFNQSSTRPHDTQEARIDSESVATKHRGSGSAEQPDVALLRPGAIESEGTSAEPISYSANEAVDYSWASLDAPRVDGSHAGSQEANQIKDAETLSPDDFGLSVPAADNLDATWDAWDDVQAPTADDFAFDESQTTDAEDRNLKEPPRQGTALRTAELSAAGVTTASDGTPTGSLHGPSGFESPSSTRGAEDGSAKGARHLGGGVLPVPNPFALHTNDTELKVMRTEVKGVANDFSGGDGQSAVGTVDEPDRLDPWGLQDEEVCAPESDSWGWVQSEDLPKATEEVLDNVAGGAELHSSTEEHSSGPARFSGTADVDVKTAVKDPQMAVQNGSASVAPFPLNVGAPVTEPKSSLDATTEAKGVPTSSIQTVYESESNVWPDNAFQAQDRSVSVFVEDPATASRDTTPVSGDARDVSDAIRKTVVADSAAVSTQPAVLDPGASRSPRCAIESERDEAEEHPVESTDVDIASTAANADALPTVPPSSVDECVWNPDHSQIQWDPSGLAQQSDPLHRDFVSDAVDERHTDVTDPFCFTPMTHDAAALTAGACVKDGGFVSNSKQTAFSSGHIASEQTGSIALEHAHESAVGTHDASNVNANEEHSFKTPESNGTHEPTVSQLITELANCPPNAGSEITTIGGPEYTQTSKQGNQHHGTEGDFGFSGVSDGQHALPKRLSPARQTVTSQMPQNEAALSWTDRPHQTSSSGTVPFVNDSANPHGRDGGVVPEVAPLSLEAKSVHGETLSFVTSTSASARNLRRNQEVETERQEVARLKKFSASVAENAMKDPFSPAASNPSISISSEAIGARAGPPGSVVEHGFSGPSLTSGNVKMSDKPTVDDESGHPPDSDPAHVSLAQKDDFISYAPRGHTLTVSANANDSGYFAGDELSTDASGAINQALFVNPTVSSSFHGSTGTADTEQVSAYNYGQSNSALNGDALLNTGAALVAVESQTYDPFAPSNATEVGSVEDPAGNDFDWGAAEDNKASELTVSVTQKATTESSFRAVAHSPDVSLAYGGSSAAEQLLSISNAPTGNGSESLNGVEADVGSNQPQLDVNYFGADRCYETPELSASSAPGDGNRTGGESEEPKVGESDGEQGRYKRSASAIDLVDVAAPSDISSAHSQAHTFAPPSKEPLSSAHFRESDTERHPYSPPIAFTPTAASYAPRTENLMTAGSAHQTGDLYSTYAPQPAKEHYLHGQVNAMDASGLQGMPEGGVVASHMESLADGSTTQPLASASFMPGSTYVGPRSNSTIFPSSVEDLHVPSSTQWSDGSGVGANPSSSASFAPRIPGAYQPARSLGGSGNLYEPSVPFTSEVNRPSAEGSDMSAQENSYAGNKNDLPQSADAHESYYPLQPSAGHVGISENLGQDRSLGSDIYSYPYSIMDAVPSGGLPHCPPRPVVSWGVGGAMVTVVPSLTHADDFTKGGGVSVESSSSTRLHNLRSACSGACSNGWAAAIEALPPPPQPVQPSALLEYASMCDRLSWLDAGLESSEAESRSTMWRLLAVLCREPHSDWRLSAGSALVDSTSARSPGRDDSSFPLSSCSPTEPPSDLYNTDATRSELKPGEAAAEVERMVSAGKGAEAVRIAQDAGLWALAFVVASTVDQKLYKDSVSAFARCSLRDRSLLQTLCFSAADDESELLRKATSSSGLDEWQKTVAMLLSMRNSSAHSAEDRGSRFLRLIEQVGDALIDQRDKHMAGHICYIVSGRMQRLDGKEFVLLGASASHLSARPWSSGLVASVLQSLVLEAVVIAQGGDACPHILPYHLLFAGEIAAAGQPEVALAHCEAIVSSARAMCDFQRKEVTARVLTPTLLSSLESLEDKLRGHLGLSDSSEKYEKLREYVQYDPVAPTKSVPPVNVSDQQVPHPTPALIPTTTLPPPTHVRPQQPGYSAPVPAANMWESSFDSSAQSAQDVWQTPVPPASQMDISQAPGFSQDAGMEKKETKNERWNSFVSTAIGVLAPAGGDLSPPPRPCTEKDFSMMPPAPSMRLGRQTGPRAPGHQLEPSHMRSASLGDVSTTTMRQGGAGYSHHVHQPQAGFPSSQNLAFTASTDGLAARHNFNGTMVQESAGTPESDANSRRRSASDLTLQSQTSERKPPRQPRSSMASASTSALETSTERPAPSTRGWRFSFAEKIRAAFSGPQRAHMGTENKFVFDKEKGRWHIEGEDPDDEDDAPPPPPDDDSFGEPPNQMHAANTGYDNLQAPRGGAQALPRSQSMHDSRFAEQTHGQSDADFPRAASAYPAYNHPAASHGRLPSMTSMDGLVRDDSSESSAASVASVPLPYPAHGGQPALPGATVASNKFRQGPSGRKGRRAYVDTFNKGTASRSKPPISGPPLAPTIPGMSSSSGQSSFKIFTPTPSPTVTAESEASSYRAGQFEHQPTSSRVQNSTVHDTSGETQYSDSMSSNTTPAQTVPTRSKPRVTRPRMMA